MTDFTVVTTEEEKELMTSISSIITAAYYIGFNDGLNEYTNGLCDIEDCINYNPAQLTSLLEQKLFKK